MDIPFDGIITLLVFLVGLPALIVQFMSPEVRKVVFERGESIPREIKLAIVWSVAVVLISSVVTLCVDLLCNDSKIGTLIWNLIWLSTFIVLAGIVGETTFRFQSKYGRRENVIKELKDKVLQFVSEHGRPGGEELKQLIAIGKQSEPGFDRELILQALKDIVTGSCNLHSYHGEALSELIDGVVGMLSTSPDAEDLINYKTAVELLKTILRANITSENTTLRDQQHAVRALSALGQAVISQIKIRSGVDYILMDYEEALGRAIYRHPQLVTDISQAFLEVGTVALHSNQFLFAVAALRRLLVIAENPPKPSEESVTEWHVPFETVSDILGLMAHFWSIGESGRQFVYGRLENLSASLGNPLLIEIERACDHCRRTMEFSTADKLTQMAEDLKQGEEEKKTNRKTKRQSA